MVDGLVDVFDVHWVTNRFAGAFGRRFAEGKAALDTTAEHEQRASVGEMAMHAVVFDAGEFVGDLHLVLYAFTGPAPPGSCRD